MKLKQILVCAFSVACMGTYAQSGFVSAGADGANENGSVSYSVGQIVYQSDESSDGSVSLTQGLQQPYTISSLPLPDGLQEISSIQLAAYPNPTSDVLNISIEGTECDGLTFTVSDVKARRQMSGDIISENTPIDVRHLLPGVYFVEIQKNKQPVRAFKVVKQ